VVVVEQNLLSEPNRRHRRHRRRHLCHRKVFGHPVVPGASLDFTFTGLRSERVGGRGAGAPAKNRGGGFASRMIENRPTPATENREEPWLCPEISVKVVGDAQARAKSPAKKAMNGGVHGF